MLIDAGIRIANSVSCHALSLILTSWVRVIVPLRPSISNFLAADIDDSF